MLVFTPRRDQDKGDASPTDIFGSTGQGEAAGQITCGPAQVQICPQNASIVSFPLHCPAFLISIKIFFFFSKSGRVSGILLSSSMCS